MKIVKIIMYIALTIQLSFLVYISFMIISTPYIICDSSVRQPNLSYTGLLYVDIYYPLLYPALVFSPILTTIILYLLYKLKIIKEKPKFVKTILLLLIITLYVYHKWGFYMNPF